MTNRMRSKGQDPSDPAVLIVDDAPAYLETFGFLFVHDAVRIVKARSGLHALEVLRREPIACVVSDYWMIGMDGIKLLDEVARIYPDVGRILLTGKADAEIVLQGRAHQVLTKDMQPDLIRRVILRKVKRYGS